MGSCKYFITILLRLTFVIVNLVIDLADFSRASGLQRISFNQNKLLLTDEQKKVLTCVYSYGHQPAYFRGHFTLYLNNKLLIPNADVSYANKTVVSHDFGITEPGNYTCEVNGKNVTAIAYKVPSIQEPLIARVGNEANVTCIPGPYGTDVYLTEDGREESYLYLPKVELKDGYRHLTCLYRIAGDTGVALDDSAIETISSKLPFIVIQTNQPKTPTSFISLYLCTAASAQENVTVRIDWEESGDCSTVFNSSAEDKSVSVELDGQRVKHVTCRATYMKQEVLIVELLPRTAHKKISFSKDQLLLSEKGKKKLTCVYSYVDQDGSFKGDFTVSRDDKAFIQNGAVSEANCSAVSHTFEVTDPGNYTCEVYGETTTAMVYEIPTKQQTVIAHVEDTVNITCARGPPGTHRFLIDGNFTLNASLNLQEIELKDGLKQLKCVYILEDSRIMENIAPEDAVYSELPFIVVATKQQSINESSALCSCTVKSCEKSLNISICWTEPGMNSQTCVLAENSGDSVSVDLDYDAANVSCDITYIHQKIGSIRMQFSPEKARKKKAIAVSEGLSAGEKVAVGISVLVGIALIVVTVIMVFLYCRRIRRDGPALNRSELRELNESKD